MNNINSIFNVVDKNRESDRVELNLDKVKEFLAKRRFNGWDSHNKTIMERLSGPCGSGKTHALVQHIARLDPATHDPVIIACITKALCDQTHRDLIKIGVSRAKVIHSECRDPTSDSVHENIMDFLNDKTNNAKVLVCTHSSIEKLGYFPEKYHTTLYIDEVPQLDKFDTLYLPYNSSVLLSKVVEKRDTRVELYRLSLAKEGKKFLNRDFDSIDNVITPILHDINQGHEVYVLAKEYDELCEVDGLRADPVLQLVDNQTCDLIRRREGKLTILTLKTPLGMQLEGYKKVVFLGNKIESTLLHKHWENNYPNLLLGENQDLSKNLRYTEYTNGHRLKIVVLYDIKTWSKYQLGLIEGGIEAVDQKAAEYIDGRDFITATNNNISNPVLDNLPNCKKIPVEARGLNSYANCDIVYLTPALNRTPTHIKMLDMLGMDFTSQKLATMHEAYEQLLNRSSIRNPLATNEVILIVPDNGTANYISSLYKNSTVINLETKEEKIAIGVNKLSKAQRNRRDRYKKKVEELKSLGLIRVVSSSEVEEGLVLEGESCDIESNLGENDPFQGGNSGKIPLKSIENLARFSPLNASDVHIDLFCSGAYNKWSQPKLLLAESIKSFADLMESTQQIHQVAHKFLMDPVTREEVTPFIFPAKFIDHTTDKSFDNVDYASFLALDFDNGPRMTPEVFNGIFDPAIDHGGDRKKVVKKKHCYIIFNSFSHDPANGVNKFRVFMFVDRCIAPHEYKGLYNYVESVLDSHGFSSRQKIEVKNEATGKVTRELNPDWSGLDFTSSFITQAYFLPCTNTNRPEATFFEYHNLKGRNPARDIPKCLLKVDEISSRYCYETTAVDTVEYQVITPAVTAHITPDNVDTALSAYTPDKPYSLDSLLKLKAKADKLIESETDYQTDPTLKGEHHKEFFKIIARAYHLYKGDVEKTEEVARRNLSCRFTDNNDRESQIAYAIDWLVKRRRCQ